MIKVKIGRCLDCPANSKPKYIIAAGRCEAHYWRYRTAVKKKQAVSRRLINDPQPKRSSKKSVCLPFASPFALRNWYLLQIFMCDWVCENCKTAIIPDTERVCFSSQAHILPKEHFPSVKLNMDNHLTLGPVDCPCHSRWDLSWKSASKMEIYAHARTKVALLIPFLSAQELRKLPYIFKDLVK